MVYRSARGGHVKRLDIFGFSSLTPQLIAMLMILFNLFLTVLPVRLRLLLQNGKYNSVAPGFKRACLLVPSGVQTIFRVSPLIISF
jgi:hypothetical protein